MPNFARLLWYLGTGLRRLHWDRDRLRKYQEKRLRKIVDHAYESVPFYHEKFTQAGIHPSDIKTLDDLSKLPMIPKVELKQQNANSLISQGLNPKRLKVVKTSGSTGQPFQVYLNRAEDDWRKSIYMRANISCGQRARDRWVVITSPGHFNDTTGIQRKLALFAQTYVSVFSSVSEQVAYVSRVNAQIIDGYSGSVLLLAKEARRRQIETIRPRIVFGTAELIDSFSKSLIEETFDAPYYDQFGCAELDRTAWQCPEKAGYHIDADSAIMQFVDHDGVDVSPGERGEIVYTSLFNYSMPIIRYAVGDVGIPSDEKCTCDRTLPLMKVVEGRKGSIIVLPSGNSVSPMAFATSITSFELRDQIYQYRILQKRADLIKIEVVKNSPIEDDVLRKRLQEHLVKTFQEQGDSKLRESCFDVEFVDEIKVDLTGKHRTISSEIDIA